MAGSMDFEFRFRTSPKTPSQSKGRGPFRILVLGDFSGRSSRAGGSNDLGLADRRPLPIDIDNFEDRISRLSPEIELETAGKSGPTLRLDFHSLEDFHPDVLFRKLGPFQTLQRTRERLLDPDTFRDTVSQLTKVSIGEAPAKAPSSSTDSSPPPPASADQEDDGDTLSRLLGFDASTTPASGSSRSGTNLDISGFLRSIVGDDIVSADDPRQDEFVRLLDREISAQMRHILHHPSYQSLEASWRSLHQLVVGLETDEELRIDFLDVSRGELERDLLGRQDSLEDTVLYKLLVETETRTLGGRPWSILLGDFSFGPGADDTGLLAALGTIASQVGCPFLAAASSQVVGTETVFASSDPTGWSLDPEDQTRWKALRHSTAARWIGLALPRMILRLPYGSKTDEIDSFDFDEIASFEQDHDAYLWGNPAFACAQLLAAEYQDQSWSMSPGPARDLVELPVVSYRDRDDEPQMKPCAEIDPTERTVEAILEQGIMPLASVRHTDAVRVVRFQSIADPPAPLSGPWSR